MNEYEKIIKIVVENVSARKMMEEDAVTILISLFNIVKAIRFSLAKILVLISHLPRHGLMPPIVYPNLYLNKQLH